MLLKRWIFLLIYRKGILKICEVPRLLRLNEDVLFVHLIQKIRMMGD